MRYEPHETLVRPARSRPALWRTVAGGLTAITIYYALIYAVYGVVAAARGTMAAEEAFSDVFLTTLDSGDALWLLASFACLIIGTLAAANLFQGRSPFSLTGPPVRAMADFTRVLWALTLLYAVLWAILPMGVEVAPNLSGGLWLMLLPVAAPAILIQCGAEELFFRGYLQQQLAARFRSPAVWIGLPALLFAWGHYAPEQSGPNAIAAALWAGAFAAAAADLTARTGTLGAAVALHFANNASAILLVALPGPVSGLALYTYPYAADDPALAPFLLVDLAAIGVSWLAARVALRV